MGELARPPSDPSELYLARQQEVTAFRPVMSGDVFADVEIPGVEGGAGYALVLSHPCAMREGPHLSDHIMMCAIRKGSPIQPDHWLGNFGVMPLPELLDRTSKHRATFDLAGRVPTSQLEVTRRQACLSDVGIVLLVQRLAFHHTRVAIELEPIHASIAHILEEAALLEEWVEDRTVRVGRPLDATEIIAAESSFDVLMTQVDPFTRVSYRDKLKDPMAKASVRRLVRRALAG